MSRLRIEYVPPESLKAAAYNPRRMPAEALRRLAALLDRHGFVTPVIARRRDRLIIGGHQRIRANALRRKPDARVPVVFLDDVSDARAKALNVALNNAEAQGRFDLAKLADVLDGLGGCEPDLPVLTGFSEPEIAELLGTLNGPAAPVLEEELAEVFQVVVEVPSEAEQRRVYDRMTREGYRCRLLML